jgi:alpha-glucoside transport system substrate-binding protein
MAVASVLLLPGACFADSLGSRATIAPDKETCFMTRSPRSRWLMAAAGASALALTLSGCGGDDNAGGAGGSPTGDACAPFADYGDLSGKQVGIYTSIQSPEAEMYQATLKHFEDCTGAKVTFEGSNEFEAQLKVRQKAGNPPDIALIPQPGLLANQVATGAVKKPPAAVVENVDKNWSPDFKKYGTVDGTFYAAPNSTNFKSLVWYSPTMFSDNGWTVPTTWDELMTLTQTIKDSGKVDKPWCVGIESGAATGWPLTDWLEDVMLRTAGSDAYDQWVSHEIPFNDPKVATALDAVGAITKNPDYVNGGLGDVKSVATTRFQDAGLPILDGQCAMHRQANFYGAQFPEGTNIAEDGDVWAFYLPGLKAEDKPVLIAGEFVTAYADRPEVQALQTWMSTADYANTLAMNSTGIASANLGADPNNFTGLTKTLVQVLQDPAATARFDGSDQMPAAVGSAALWSELTKWQTGQSTQATLDNVEKAWPSS